MLLSFFTGDLFWVTNCGQALEGDSWPGHLACPPGGSGPAEEADVAGDALIEWPSATLAVRDAEGPGRGRPRLEGQTAASPVRR